MSIQITLTGAANDTQYYIRTLAANPQSRPQTEQEGAVVSATPKAEIPLAELPVGSVITFPVGGVAVGWIVVHKGKSSGAYDDSFADTVTLLMQNIHSKAIIKNTTTNGNDYQKSEVHAYLNAGFLDLVDPNVRQKIKQVRIPYTNGTGKNGSVASGGNGLLTKVYLLSATEVGFVQTTTVIGQHNHNIEGSKLDYFILDSSGDSQRIGLLDGVATYWWLRSPYPVNVGYMEYVRAGGDESGTSVTDNLGIRPALVLPDSMCTDATPNPDGSYNLLLG